MKKRTDGELHQDEKTKNFNEKTWIRVISIVLCFITVVVICLEVSLFVSNDKIEALQEDLNAANQKIEALKEENKLAASEIGTLQSDLALTNQKIEALAVELLAEISSLKDALNESKEKEESLKNSLEILENKLIILEDMNQSAQNEIEQLKTDIQKAKIEIIALKAMVDRYHNDNVTDTDDKIRIYIDQGHNPTSYHNAGAYGNGLYEQDITFLIGSLLAELLKADGRFEVQVSRSDMSVVLGTDNKSSVMARVEGAAAFNADYLISLHTNAFTTDSVNGIEAWVADESSESYVFGETLLNGMEETTNLRNRGIYLDPDLDILEYSTMPAVLLEMGFISNSEDAALLSEHPELFVQGIYNGILNYFGLINRI